LHLSLVTFIYHHLQLGQVAPVNALAVTCKELLQAMGWGFLELVIEIIVSSYVANISIFVIFVKKQCRFLPNRNDYLLQFARQISK
jgi:hypothetical protein